MPGPLDVPLRTVAHVLLLKQGKPITMRTVTRGEYVNGVVPETVVDRSVHALIEAYPQSSGRGADRVTNEGVKIGDLKITVSALEVEPDVPVAVENGDDGAVSTLWVVDGKVLTTLKADPINANEMAVLYVCQARA